MDIINRIKNVLLSPKTEWPTIEQENAPHAKVFTTYVVPLGLIPVIAIFIGYGLIGYSFWGVRFHSVEWGVRMAIVQLITMYVGVYLTAFVISTLAENFGAKKDLNRAFSLVAYSYTPIFIAGIFNIYPSISWIAMLAGIYGLYLLYIGLQPMMKVPAEKQSTYFVISLLVMIAVFAILSYALAAIVAPSPMSSLNSFLR